MRLTSLSLRAHQTRILVQLSWNVSPKKESTMKLLNINNRCHKKQEGSIFWFDNTSRHPHETKTVPSSFVQFPFFTPFSIFSPPKVIQRASTLDIYQYINPWTELNFSLKTGTGTCRERTGSLPPQPPVPWLTGLVIWKEGLAISRRYSDEYRIARFHSHCVNTEPRKRRGDVWLSIPEIVYLKKRRCNWTNIRHPSSGRWLDSTSAREITGASAALPRKVNETVQLEQPGFLVGLELFG
jgi:hypothetical protein